MDISSRISKLTSTMSKRDTTNSRTLGRLNARANGIARYLGDSNDIPQQQKFESVIGGIAERLADAESAYSSGISTHIAPSVYHKKKEIIFDADRRLNFFQPPPKGHPEEMEKASLRDKMVLGSMIERLLKGDDGLLKGVSETLSATERPRDLDSGRKASPERLASDQPSSTPTGTGTLRNEDKAYEAFEQKLALFKHGNHGIYPLRKEMKPRLMRHKKAPSIMIGISVMGSEKGEATAHLIPLNYTFFALADTVVDFNSEEPLPDFWTKEIDHDKNTVTKSGLRWEWQDPNTKVVDAMSKKGHVRLESVCKEVEYVVVLVKNGESESGIPMDIPRRRRQAAFFHMQKEFPNYTVSKVHLLQGGDAGNVVFDSRSFPHQTNPLLVELRTAPTGGEKIDKGKGVEIVV